MKMLLRIASSVSLRVFSLRTTFPLLAVIVGCLSLWPTVTPARAVADTCISYNVNVMQAFRAQARPGMVPGDQIVVYPYAIVQWSIPPNAAGEALLKFECSRGWVLLTSGGGFFDVQYLEEKSVPKSIAQKLIAEGEASFPTPSPAQRELFRKQQAYFKEAGLASRAELQGDFREALQELERAAAMNPDRTTNPCSAGSDAADVQAMKETVGLLASGTINKAKAFEWFTQRSNSLQAPGTEIGNRCRAWAMRRASHTP